MAVDRSTAAAINKADAIDLRRAHRPEGAARCGNGVARSALSPSAMVAITCSVAGLRVSKERPGTDGARRPSIRNRLVWLRWPVTSHEHNYMQRTSYTFQFYC
jgi:hypothetical protein